MTTRKRRDGDATVARGRGAARPRAVGLGAGRSGAARLRSAALGAAALAIAAAAAGGTWAQTPDAAPDAPAPIALASTVSAATLYPRGAMVARSAPFAAPAGRATLRIDDLPTDIDADTLRVSGAAAGADFTILGVEHEIARPARAPLPDAEREAIEAEIEAKGWRLRAAEDALAAAEARAAYMAAFRAATVAPAPAPARPGARAQGGGAALLAEAARWPAAWAAIAEEEAAARGEARDAERRAEELRRDLEALERRLRRTGPPAAPRSVLLVSIAAAAPVENGALTVRYLTSKAGWRPLYDLRLDAAETGGGDARGARVLTLTRRAEVFQTTGETWPEVRLTLSTAQPALRVAAAPPRTEEARLRPPPSELAAKRRELNDRLIREGLLSAPAAETEADASRALAAPLAASAGAPPRPAAERDALTLYAGATVTLAAPDPATLPGDGARRRIRLGETQAEATAELRATPSLDETAYLVAAHQNGELPLLPGRATLYRDGVFVGRATLEAAAPGATAILPFGRYEAVSVRHAVRDRKDGEEGIFTTSNRRRAAFEITAENLGAETLRMTVFDSRPFTETEEIVVTPLGERPDETDVDGRRGALAWRFPLPPGAAKTLRFGYEITWPEAREIDLRPQPTPRPRR